MARPLPGCCLSLDSSSAMFAPTSVVLFQSADSRVVDATILGMVLISSATTGSSARALSRWDHSFLCHVWVGAARNVAGTGTADTCRARTWGVAGSRSQGMDRVAREVGW
jgi:hypothetical protein